MARYRGPRLRIVRRLGELPGLTRKVVAPHKSYAPGQHGRNTKKPSDYLVRLKEKQKLRYNYGVSEHQLFRYVQTARKSKGATGSIIIQLLEMRLDTILFRSGFAPTIPAARQIVSHSHVLVNGKKVNIVSFLCKKGDQIEIVSKAKNYVKSLTQNTKAINSPDYLKIDSDKLKLSILELANPQQACLKINELLVVEYYSQR